MPLKEEWFSAFRRGIRRIVCEHSNGSPKTKNAPPGIHQHREILFVLRGESEFPLNHKIFKIKAGDVILINRWISHRVGYPPSDRNMVYLWFYLFPTHLNLLVHQVDQDGNVSYAIKWVELATDLKLVVERRWDELDKLSPENALANLDCFMRQPLTMLLDELRFYLRTSALKEEKTLTGNAIVNSIQQIIEAKIGRDCSLAQLEKFTGFSRFYISHLFKSAYGISIGEYINRVRLVFFESAKKQGFSHKQIASELGFSTSSALLMWYRKIR
ncbi:MAG: AraC family transcriptional regulator [Victivallales bacterium]|nr:AraC family transcriptional regulator [Victivallales bacterium]